MPTAKEVFHLTNRQTKGFVRLVFAMLKIRLPKLNYFTLSRRGKTLKVHLPQTSSGSLNLALDSTGLRVYGEGERKVCQHGHSKRRTWRELHLGRNPNTSEVAVVMLIENSISDDANVLIPPRKDAHIW